MSDQELPVPSSLAHRTANYLFKRKYGRYFRMAFLLSLVCHIAIILGMPAFIHEFGVQMESKLEAVDLPPEVVIPPPPRPLNKPSIPEMAQEEIDEDITIDETTPPPPMMFSDIPGGMGSGGRDGDGDFLMAAEVWPKIKTMPPKPEMPKFIANAGVDLVTVIEFYVTSVGLVDPRTRIAVSSDWPVLDSLAVDWARQVTFFPALNRGEPVAVRASIPIKWKSK